MPSQFEYSGVDHSGQPTRGFAEGETPIAVVLRLRNAGITVYSIKKKLLSEPPPFGMNKRISASDLIVFNSQLASLLKTRLPLAESLRLLSKELKKSRLRTVLERITGRLEAGENLYESLLYHREYFPPLYLSMVAAGEKSGNLADVLYQAARYFESVEDFRRKFLNALIYPAMLTVLAIAVLVFLIKLMVPPYVEMYSGFHADFPPTLRLLVYLEQLLRPNFFWSMIVPIVLIASAAFLVIARRSETVRMYWGKVVLQTPVCGRMIMEAILAQGIATVSILLQSGVPLHESLDIVRNLTSNRPLRKAFGAVAGEVLEGNPLSQSLIMQPVFPLEIAWMIRTGETSGDFIRALDDASRMCQSKFESSSRVILSVLEPALLVILGAVVVSMAISLFYPLYSLSKYLGG